LKRHWDPERARLSRLRDHDLLRQLGALRQDGQLSNCGEIMFCDSTGPAERIVYVYRRTPGGEPTEHRRLSGPLLVAYDEAMRSVEARRRLTPVSLPRGQQIHIEDFPNRAVREVLSNAVIHRDYQSPAPVHVAHSPQVFEVTSPGPLVAGVTPDNILTHESKPRNPALARTARLLGLAEEVGTGIDRVFKEMLLSGKGIPTIESDPSRVRVTLTGGGPNVRVPLYVDQLPEEEREDVDTLLVLFALCHSRTVDAVGMATLLQKPPASAQAVLQRLSQDSVGMLEATRGTARRASPRYRLRSQAVASLGTAVRYNRRLPDDVDRKVIAHVREYEKITNRTVRNLLDVDVYRAAEILSDLVGREVLVRTTEATRGPSVEYGPGLRFPTSGGASDATPTRRWRRGRPGGSA
jgi:ATP-dependent DNA helicase RecG